MHGRTPEQRSEPADYNMIKLIKSSLSIPVIANGNIKSYEQALQVIKYTRVDGQLFLDGLLNIITRHLCTVLCLQLRLLK